MSHQDRADLLLPERGHLLHIGPQKTGSTAIQAALHLQRAELREHGVVYPGPGPRPMRAVAAGLGFSTPRGAPAPRQRAWRGLLRQLEEARDLRVCISHEGFGRATDEQARRVVKSLGGPRPHVVAVARRYDRLMPSQWQQRVKAGERRSYDEWLSVVLDPEQSASAPYRNLWVPHDTVGLLERWGAAMGPDGTDALTLIVSDDSDRGLLFRSFEALLGLPDGLLRPVDDRSNRSLSFSEVEMLRQVNLHFATHGWNDQDYFALVHRGITRALMAAELPAEDPRIPQMPAWAWERLAELSATRVSQLRQLGLRTVGDLDALLLDPATRPGDGEVEPVRTISVVTASRVVEGALLGGVAVRRKLARTTRRRRAQGTGAGTTGSGRTGAGRTGAGRTGAGRTGSGKRRTQAQPASAAQGAAADPAVRKQEPAPAPAQSGSVGALSRATTAVRRRGRALMRR